MTRAPKPVAIAVRLPLDLYEMIDAYAEHADVNLSEALRRLAVEALEAHGTKQTVSDDHGDREQPGWKQPLSETDQR